MMWLSLLDDFVRVMCMLLECYVGGWVVLVVVYLFV